MGVTSDQKLALKAWRLWAKETGKGETTRSLYEFADYLGDPWYGDRNDIVNMDNPIVRRRVELLTGPNGYTMLKVLLVQKEPKP